MKILHIAVHIGGGVGTVLKNWIKKDFENEHTILLLNHNYYDNDYNIKYKNMRNKYDDINILVSKADIVIIHFWNHPYLFEFLINSKMPANRLCIWSHISGLYSPYNFTKDLINYPDKFLFSSPVSGENFIWTTGGIEKYIHKEKVLDKSKFVVGYIGTLDYSKLHPKFVDICKGIHQKIPNVKFIICGTGGDEEKIKNRIAIHGIDEIFEFKGFINNNIEDIITTFDVFGYPLNEKHFGTCEQVLGETMACGVEPVVLNNPSEKYIVEGYGRVSNNIKDYINNINDIFLNPVDKTKILKDRALELYDINKMINLWNNIFIDIIKEEKKERTWSGKQCKYGFEIFAESIGDNGKILLEGNKREIKKLFDTNNQWRSKSKGSINQYLEAFPDDEKLKEWAKL
jgi:glycosyltransferase involved in cell wall biosynthesis